MQRRENIFSSAVTNLKDWTERFYIVDDAGGCFSFFIYRWEGIIHDCIVLSSFWSSNTELIVETTSQPLHAVSIFNEWWKAFHFSCQVVFACLREVRYCVDYAFNVTHIFSHRKFNTFIHSFHQWVAVGSESFCSVQLTEH